VGSFLFHTMPNASTLPADTVPIGFFMLTYLYFALRRFVALPLSQTVAALALFIAALYAASQIRCWDGRAGFLDGIPVGAQARCLNGSLGYAPALGALILIGGYLVARGHRAGPFVLAAACAFTVSFAFRSLDMRLCADWIMFGHRMGTHFLWHLLNALTLFLLLAAAIRSGAKEPSPDTRLSRPAV
jgi:hypothetical protein